MKTLKLIAALSIGAALSACGAVPDIASRNAPFEALSTQDAPVQHFQAPAPLAQTAQAPTLQAQAPQTQVSQSFSVAKINVRVPRSLKASEANGYYPQADIVWRGDPIGDRHQQIANIFNTAFTHGTKDMAGPVPVVLDVELTRFHSITERTRLRLGGVHNMEFNLSVRSATTGQLLMPTRKVEANLPALGGMQALAAEARGQTQKVRVTGYLAHVIDEELKKRVVPQPNGGFALLE